MILLALPARFFCRKTIVGRYVLCAWSNEEAARLSGINVTDEVFGVSLSGLFAGIGGMLLVARLAWLNPRQVFGYELDGIAAVVIAARV